MTALDEEQKQNVLNMLLKDYEIMRQEIRSCHSLYYRLAFGFGVASAGGFAAAITFDLPDGLVVFVLGFLVPLLYVAEYALLIQYFFIYVRLFVWRTLVVEKLLSELVGVPDLMNFERTFGRLYFDPDLKKAINDANGNPKRKLFARVQYALRPQMRAHYLIALVAALPAIGGFGFLFFTPELFDKYPVPVIAGLMLFILVLVADLGLWVRKKKQVDEGAAKICREMITSILGTTRAADQGSL